MHRAMKSLRSLIFSRAELRRFEAAVPLFLCPALLDPPVRRLRKSIGNPRALATSARRRTAQGLSRSSAAEPLRHAPTPPVPSLPLSCPGCGAPRQTVDRNAVGYYSASRRVVKAYLTPSTHPSSEATGKGKEDVVFNQAVQNLDHSLKAQLSVPEDDHVSEGDALLQLPQPPPAPVCDRCHNLLNHAAGVPIHHPSLDSIERTIAESPYKHNHIYHVLDAADFPMSLVPNLTTALKLSPLRTQNRRSKHMEYSHGRVADVSFIITRSDLLAPTKEQVDSLMPYLVEVLRDALGRSGRTVRLGNVRCVSSKRGWWTKEVKENIWERGGAGWMVGKVNVGKSNLFEVVFPKGRNVSPNSNKIRSAAAQEAISSQIITPHDAAQAHTPSEQTDDEAALVDETSLLPPAQREVPYPVMPVVSSLPGTTASPIRVPFGNGRGELIDLPGLARTSLDTYVRPENRLNLVMNGRVVPERISVKPGQSLLLGGGLVRITPTTQNLVFLMHPFVPLASHVTSTQKALAMEAGERVSGISSVMGEGVGEKMRSAGLFSLRWDVTKAQAGPLTRKDAVALSPERLPFTVWATDILIEGVGWVEIVAQTRKGQRLYRNDGDIGEALDEVASKATDVPYPEIEVVTPEGQFVGNRRPMNAWLLNKPKKKTSELRNRPRKSMVSVKNQRQKGTTM
ncbi:gtp-binding protein [Diplodia corticola]|uniref:Gtp-binding protein n=1 Tax=Diplodia corticola TaxID=236234 RepID=A0A1J9QV33_9PEZI|nr:gtp-binding protein [Diplodia corticola]OJD31834.1 gtp-binding protein [Diplodia corticola]